MFASMNLLGKALVIQLKKTKNYNMSESSDETKSEKLISPSLLENLCQCQICCTVRNLEKGEKIYKTGISPQKCHRLNLKFKFIYFIEGCKPLIREYELVLGLT